jgi:hypothetical protein
MAFWWMRTRAICSQIEINLDDLEPHVALPHAEDHVVDSSQVGRHAIGYWFFFAPAEWPAQEEFAPHHVVRGSDSLARLCA